MGPEGETDYLVVGCGASGMAFVDEVLTHCDASVTVVDRRHAPGGHWVDAYPFVRLHQPSAFYGVGSRPLGGDAIDPSGYNEGFYELAGPEQICAYYEQVMRRRFLPSGRVRYFPNCDYLGEGRFASRLSGNEWQMHIRRKLVDTAYLEGTIPANTPPPFAVEEGARCVPVGHLARLDEAPDRYVIVGAGKTAMDACIWLLQNRVPASSICWIKPREAWWLNRKFQQPLTLLPDLYLGASLQIAAMAEAKSTKVLFENLESAGLFLRVDHNVTPTMFRAAIVSEREVEMLRQIENVVRMGHVRRIEREEITLDEGRIPTTARTLHVHCAAQALPRRPLLPVFAPGRVTVQMLRWGFAPFQAALIGFIEATLDSDEEKNRLCPPFQNFDTAEHFLRAFLTSMVGDRARASHEGVDKWMKSTRLNPGSGIRAHLEDPRVRQAYASIKRFAGPAAVNLKRLIDDG